MKNREKNTVKTHSSTLQFLKNLFTGSKKRRQTKRGEWTTPVAKTFRDQYFHY